MDFAGLQYPFDNAGDYAVDLSSQHLHDYNTCRAELLARAVHVDERLFPALNVLFGSLLAGLGMEGRAELFVYNDASVQASCLAQPGQEKCFVLVSSAAVNLFDDMELEFVLGHELGHHMYRHHEYPRLGDGQKGLKAINLLQLSRAAEISADRVGLLACRSLHSAMGAMVKAASGLGTRHLGQDLMAYLDQAGELAESGVGSLYDSHPMLPLRAKAISLFARSRTFLKITDGRVEDMLDDAEVNQRVSDDLARVTGFRLDKINSTAMREALIWSVVSIYLADGHLNKQEQAALQVALGEITARKIIDMLRSGGPELLRSKLEGALNSARDLPARHRLELLVDLEKFASASGDDDVLTLQQLTAIAVAIGVDRPVQVRPWSHFDEQSAVKSHLNNGSMFC